MVEKTLVYTYMYMYLLMAPTCLLFGSFALEALLIGVHCRSAI